MRILLLLLISVLTTLVVVQAVSGAMIPITQMPALYVSDYGAGVTHPINSYTIKPTGAVTNGGWMILGTNDQAIFARIDARANKAFSAGETQTYNVANIQPFRWYYLYLQEGFTVGNTVEFHLNELTPAPVPTGPESTIVDVVIERAPLVIIVDFSGRATRITEYNFTSSVNLPAGQVWQLRGTNNPEMLGSADPGLFTLLDERSGEAFTGGNPKQFTVTTPGTFLYYVFYLQGGFSSPGMNLEIHLSEPSAPTPPSGGGPEPTQVTTPVPRIPPEADFEGNPRAGYPPLPVTFIDTSTGQTLRWHWDFGDGETSPMQSPMHIYTTPGVYTVNFTACNEAGCSWVSKVAYVYVIPTGTPGPTETPRYYIKIGGESSGTTSAPGEAQPATEGSGEASPSTGEGTGTGGDTGSGGSGSGGSGSGGTGSGSTAAGGGQASGGTGGTTGQVSSPEASPSIPITVIENLIEALGDVVTTTQGLLEYLQGQLFSLFGR